MGGINRRNVHGRAKTPLPVPPPEPVPPGPTPVPEMPEATMTANT